MEQLFLRRDPGYKARIDDQTSLSTVSTLFYFKPGVTDVNSTQKSFKTA